MGFLDDAASIVSSRTAPHTKRSSGKSHRKHRDRYEEYKRRSRERDDDHHHHPSRSRSRSRSRKHHKSSKSTVGSVVGGITGYAASFIGGGDDSDDDGLAYSSYGGAAPSKKSRDRDYENDDRDGSRSLFGGGDSYAKNNASSAAALFGLGNSSKSSFFAGFGGRPRSPGSSRHTRSPRPNFVARLLKKVRRLIRDLIYYAKRHPLKVFMLVIMPLVSGGLLTALLAKVGIRLPKFVERLISIATKAGTGDSVGLAREAAGMVKSTGGVGALVRSSTFEKGVGMDGSQWELARKVTKFIS
ncbi:hypothetical protein QBC38DRAFT_123919 [Podospora fimiseda]|uniref:Uncharacterized protein n=1 Tax=Podospora fimiseda TaxID=252190 RepID=A0AAN7BUB6_9PEZI|nr:hypothetical protein QBC38DRAFT_123919 [Podospora fimiseda]